MAGIFLSLSLPNVSSGPTSSLASAVCMYAWAIGMNVARNSLKTTCTGSLVACVFVCVCVYPALGRGSLKISLSTLLPY